MEEKRLEYYVTKDDAGRFSVTRSVSPGSDERVSVGWRPKLVRAKQLAESTAGRNLDWLREGDGYKGY